MNGPIWHPHREHIVKLSAVAAVQDSDAAAFILEVAKVTGALPKFDSLH